MKSTVRNKNILILYLLQFIKYFKTDFKLVTMITMKHLEDGSTIIMHIVNESQLVNFENTRLFIKNNRCLLK